MEPGSRVSDALRAPWPPGPFDVVLLDPPFEFWADPRAQTLLDRARQALVADGLLVLKLPARQALPEGGGWSLIDRREAGEAAFALLKPA